MKLFRKYRKLISIFVLVAVVVAAFVISVNIFSPSIAEACRDQGCAVSFWKSHTSNWVGHNPGDTLRTLFTGADKYNLGGTALINALGWNVTSCNPVTMAAKILLREGVAAKLNVSNPGVDYHLSGSQVTIMVNNALASGNPLTMYNAQRLLDRYNNAGCPFCQQTRPPRHH